MLSQRFVKDQINTSSHLLNWPLRFYEGIVGTRCGLGIAPVRGLETHPERPFLANDDIENKGLLGREIAKKRLSG
jgi:hypothetical protein